MNATCSYQAFEGKRSWASNMLALWMVFYVTCVFAQAPAAGTYAAPAISAAELDKLVGPIALYPDDLVSIILPASTYPLEIVQADPARGEEASPFGPLIAASADYLKGHKEGDSFHGYHFRILTRQGKSAPGGAYSYVINGRMIAGFAMVAYPAEYGESGVMTFIVSNNGKIYQKDLGKGSTLINEFNPDASWMRVEDPS